MTSQIPAGVIAGVLGRAREASLDVTFGSE